MKFIRYGLCYLVPQDKYGEQFKRESILLTDEDNDDVYVMMELVI